MKSMTEGMRRYARKILSRDRSFGVWVLRCGLLSLVLWESGCAISKPCAEAGDTTWPTKIPGDAHCYQKKQPDGRWVNDGKYYLYSDDGVILLEGNFVAGKKDGIWVEYNEKGEKIREHQFENGVEYMGATGSRGTQARPSLRPQEEVVRKPLLPPSER